MRASCQRADSMSAVQQLGNQSAGNVSSCAGDENRIAIHEMTSFFFLFLQKMKEEREKKLIGVTQHPRAGGELTGETVENEFVERPHGIPI